MQISTQIQNKNKKNKKYQKQYFYQEFQNLSELKILLESQIIQFNKPIQKLIKTKNEILILLYCVKKEIQNKKENKNEIERITKNQITQKQHLNKLIKSILNNQFQLTYKSNKQIENKQEFQNIKNQAEKLNYEYKNKLQNQQQHQNEQNQVFVIKSKFMDDQILQMIVQLNKKAHLLIKKQLISKFSFDHSAKLLNLIKIQLSQSKMLAQKNEFKFNIHQLIQIVKDYILAIFIYFPEFNMIAIEIIKSVMNFYENLKLKQDLFRLMREQVAKFYKEQFFKLRKQQNKQGQLQKVIVILTVIQAIQSCSKTQGYTKILLSNQLFTKDIYLLLLCNKVQSQIANSIAINMYGTLLRQLNLYSPQCQTFINLYSTLRCFGTHLIRDVWNLFYDFIQMQQCSMIYTKAQLIDIIFYKLQHHQNINVIKHCIQSILQNQRSYILFDKVPDAIYNSLIRILNYGMHYLDCVFHMDSKMFPLISNFFSQFFNKYIKQNQFQMHMNLFLQAICNKINFDHTIVGILDSFTKINKKSKSINKNNINYIVCLIQKFYLRIPIRKRHQLMIGICYLIKNHLSTTHQILQIQQKKEKQLKNEKNNNQISLSYLLKECLMKFPYKYLTLDHSNYSTRNFLFQIIIENFSKQDINYSLQNFCHKFHESFQNVSLHNYYEQSNNFNLVLQNFKSIQLLLFILHNQIDGSQINFQNKYLTQDTIYSLRTVYLKIYQNYVLDLAQSLYIKPYKRSQGIKVQSQFFKYWEISKSIKKYNFLLKMDQFIEKILTNITLLISEDIQNLEKQNNNFEKGQQYISFLNNQIKQIIKVSFSIIYESHNNLDGQNQEKMSKIGSQFLEWATDNIQNKECIQLLITALKIRIEKGKVFKICYIEESIYKLCNTFYNSQFNSKSIQKIKQISPLNKLRILVLTSTILFQDPGQIIRYLPKIYSQLQDLADRYDYQNYSQIFNLIQKIFLEFKVDNNLEESKTLQKQIYSKEKQNIKRLSKLIDSLMYSMLQILQYGIKAQDVISFVNSAVQITFSFAIKYKHFDQDFIKMLQKVIQIGKQYWMFERVVTIKVIAKLNQLLNLNIKKFDFKNIFSLLQKIITIQEYRGYDSSIQLETHIKNLQFYSQLRKNLHKQTDYQGTFCRLAGVYFISYKVKQSLQNHQKNVNLNIFLEQFFIKLLNQVKQQLKQKMFLTGLHKTRLKYWQCILAFNIEWIYKSNSCQNSTLISIEQIILICIEIVSQTNVNQIKYYHQLFLMKLLINKHSQNIITSKILSVLGQKLVQCVAHITKNVSYMVITGLTMNYLCRTIEINQNHRFYKSLQKLFNNLLSYSCSHIAYFRGLSQYFCLDTNFIKSQYTKIFRQAQGRDSDTIILKERLDILLRDYFEEIHHWDVKDQIFVKLPTFNNCIVSDTYYQQRLKKLGQQLVRQIKAQIGFLPYKDVWIQAVKNLGLTNNIKIEQIQNIQQDQSIFQRKIDPSLDYIYYSRTKLQGFEMKILITGSKKIPIYGHLSRTGQIFGVSQLILPNIQIIEDQQYKNVSCTAQKWLNITGFSSKQQILNPQNNLKSLQRCLLKYLSNGYIFYLLKKHQNFNQKSILQKQIRQIKKIENRKCLFIVDIQNILPKSIKKYISQIICFGQYFSSHVQASIFIWEYFKECYNEKFNFNK